MVYNYKNLIQPRKALPNIFRKLVPYYVDDYGREYENMIRGRLEDAIYIFDSNPKDVYDFILKNEDYIMDDDFIKRSEQEYNNYIKIEKHIDSKLEKSFRKFLRNNFELESMDKNYSLLDIDFSVFSSSTIDCYNHGSEEERNDIDEKRKEYRMQCMEAGFPAITSCYSIDEIVKYQQALLDEKNQILVRESKWGKRIKKEIEKIYHFDIPYDCLVELLLEKHYCASTGVVRDEKGNSRVVVSIPLIHNISNGNLDKIFFHEMRHVVETSSKGSGVYLFQEPKYEFINEIHTEKNAILDEERMKPYVFFAMGRRKRKSFYESLFPYLGSFFEDGKMILDWLAICNNQELFENTYGERFLDELEYHLHHPETFHKSRILYLMKNQ